MAEARIRLLRRLTAHRAPRLGRTRGRSAAVAADAVAAGATDQVALRRGGTRAIPRRVAAALGGEGGRLHRGGRERREVVDSANASRRSTTFLLPRMTRVPRWEIHFHAMAEESGGIPHVATRISFGVRGPEANGARRFYGDLGEYRQPCEYRKPWKAGARERTTRKGPLERAPPGGRRLGQISRVAARRPAGQRSARRAGAGSRARQGRSGRGGRRRSSGQDPPPRRGRSPPRGAAFGASRPPPHPESSATHRQCRYRSSCLFDRWLRQRDSLRTKAKTVAARPTVGSTGPQRVKGDVSRRSSR